MAFSLFGKKPAPPPKPLAAVRPAAKPAPQRPAPVAERPQPAVPAKPAAATRPAAPPPVDEDDFGSLDFTTGDGLGGGQSIQVQEVTNHIPAVVEQAAMLYSADQAEEACAVLEDAVKSGEELGVHARRAWGMLFDLYQLLGNRPAFDALALAFAARFETSPPTWAGDGGDGRDDTLATGGRAFVSLSGVLGAKVQDSLKQLLKVADKNPVVRLDVAKVTDADETGCALLHEALLNLKKHKKECVLGGAERLAGVLSKKTVPGQRENERAWLLLLELYQRLFQQQAFEDAAVNYAVTFEVSPPSWEAPKAKSAAVAPAVAAAVEAVEGYALEGDIAAAGADIFAPLRSYAEGREEVIVNCRNLIRMDFVSAGQLLNVVCTLIATGKRVRLRGANHLVAALWEVLGLDRMATIETRKA